MGDARREPRHERDRGDRSKAEGAERPQRDSGEELGTTGCRLSTIDCRSVVARFLATPERVFLLVATGRLEVVVAARRLVGVAAQRVAVLTAAVAEGNAVLLLL